MIAAVLPATVTFLVEPPPTYPSEEPIEVGSIDRASIGTVEVVTLEGQPVWRPATEPLDPEPEALLSIRWTDAAGEAAEQRLLFRSSWEAWAAADRLRQAVV